MKFYLPFTKKRIQTIRRNNEENKSDNTNIIYNTILIDTLIFSFNDDKVTKYDKQYLYLLNYFNEFLKINYYLQHFDFLEISKEWALKKQDNASFKNVMEKFNEKGKSLKFKINEKDMVAVEKENNIVIQRKRTEIGKLQENCIPYAIDIVGPDQENLTFNIINFLLDGDLFIKRVSSSVFESSQTGIKMFTLHMIAHIPSNSSISTIRNEFTEFCDQFNLDAIMEPMK